MVRYQSETNRLEVQFQYSQEIWTRLIEKLKNGEVDLALCTKIDEDWVKGEFIGTHRLALLTPRGHRLTRPEGIHLEELNGENFVAFNISGQIRLIEYQILGRKQIDITIVKTVIIIHETGFCLTKSNDDFEIKIIA